MTIKSDIERWGRSCNRQS